MFSDFKSRGFGIEDTQLRYPDRLDRLILVMAPALYVAVSTGQWDAVHWPTPSEKKVPRTNRESRPKQNFLVYPRPPPHRQANAIMSAASSTLERDPELIDAKGSSPMADHQTRLEEQETSVEDAIAALTERFDKFARQFEDKSRSAGQSASDIERRRPPSGPGDRQRELR